MRSGSSWVVFFSMKYTIIINQYAAVTNGMNLDLVDLAIFDFIKDFANSRNCTKIQTPEGVYFWVSHRLILESMPLLNIKTNQGLMKRIDKLVEAGILEKHPKCDVYNKTLYCFGEKYELLTFTDKASAMINPVDTPQQKLIPHNESLGVPHNESLGYYNNNILYNNNNIYTHDKKKGKNEDEGRKTLFRNSEIYSLKRNDDYSLFEELFKGPEYNNIDLVYYFNVVSDWSDQKDMKRTKRGWIATIRNFIRKDADTNRQHTKRNNLSGINAEQALKFLNEDY